MYVIRIFAFGFQIPFDSWADIWKLLPGDILSLCNFFWRGHFGETASNLHTADNGHFKVDTRAVCSRSGLKIIGQSRQVPISHMFASDDRSRFQRSSSLACGGTRLVHLLAFGDFQVFLFAQYTANKLLHSVCNSVCRSIELAFILDPGTLGTIKLRFIFDGIIFNPAKQQAMVTMSSNGNLYELADCCISDSAPWWVVFGAMNQNDQS